MPATSDDVARLAGVSRATVSYVVNGKDQRISEETRQAVLAAAAELGYHPQAAGRALVTGVSNIVLMPLPRTPNNAFLPLMTELGALLVERSLTLLLMPPTDSAEAFTSTIQSVRPHAVISIGTLPGSHEDALRASGTRWIDIAASMSVPNGPNWRMAQLQARHLSELGYSPLAYAREYEAREDIVQSSREQGFRAECAALGLPEPLTITIGLGEESNAAAVAALPTNTGVAAFNDDTAVEVLHAASVLQRDVPRDLGVIGVDDTPITHKTSPTLSSVAYGVDMLSAPISSIVAGEIDHDHFHALFSAADLHVEHRGSTRQS